jgi:exosortase A
MRGLWRALAPAAPALAAGLLGLGLLFHQEAAAAVQVWNASTAYGHCWLVLPLAAWLLWERRHEAEARAIEPVPALALLALPLVAMWLVANLLGIMEGRQLAAIGCVEVLLLCVLGRLLFWALSPALLYLIFLVPFGAFITPRLQDFTAGFVAIGLDALQIPSRVTQYRIDIPEGQFYVAEACAGLRFLIASIAFGVLYAVTMFRSPWRRVAFIAAAVAVPVVANGVRALGIVVLGHVLGSAEAAETDHVLYGWIFFSIVILLLALSGMPFRQEPAPAPPPLATLPPPDARARRGRALLAALPVLALAASGPVLGPWMDSSAAAPQAGPVLHTPPGCLATGERLDGAVLTQHYQCDETLLTARLQMLPHRANPARAVEAAQGQAAALLRDGDLDAATLEVAGATPHLWVLERDHMHKRASAAVLFIDGAPALGGLRDRLRLTQDLLTGSGGPAAALAVAVVESKGDPVADLTAFLGAQGDLTARVGRLVK